MPITGCARPKRHLSRVSQAAHEGRCVPAAISPRTPRAIRTRPDSARRCSVAGRAAPHSRSLPSTTIPSWEPIRSATTTSCTPTIRAASRCPAGSHARRANPRDALDHEGSVNVRLHRMIRRGTSYGPMLPDGVLDDDGVDRGIVFVFAGRAPGATVRVREDPVAQRRNLHRFARREGSARRVERRGRRLHHRATPDSSTSRQTCHPSSSRAAASTASSPACARCAGSPN